MGKILALCCACCLSSGCAFQVISDSGYKEGALTSRTWGVHCSFMVFGKQRAAQGAVIESSDVSIRFGNAAIQDSTPQLEALSTAFKLLVTLP